MDQISSAEIERRLHDRTHTDDGELRITCEAALALANELEISPAKIGELCNLHEIKICHCQLTCF